MPVLKKNSTSFTLSSIHLPFSKTIGQRPAFESKRDDEILRAYLTFVGGNYSNLVDMAINQKQVAQLKLKAKEKKSNATIRINRPTASKDSINFGY